MRFYNGEINEGKVNILIGSDEMYEEPTRETLLGRSETDRYYVVHSRSERADIISRVRAEQVKEWQEKGVVLTNADVVEGENGLYLRVKSGEIETIPHKDISMLRWKNKGRYQYKTRRINNERRYREKLREIKEIVNNIDMGSLDSREGMIDAMDKIGTIIVKSQIVTTNMYIHLQ